MWNCCITHLNFIFLSFFLQKKAMKKQAKAQKKAMKYGIPLAGAAVGGYALHKGIKLSSTKNDESEIIMF